MLIDQKIDFPNLPNLRHNGNVISESQAIPLYIALNTNNESYFGKTNFDKVQVSQLCGISTELKEFIVEVLLVKNMKEKFEKTKQKKILLFDRLNDFLVKYKRTTSFLGYKTYPDVYLY